MSVLACKAGRFFWSAGGSARQASAPALLAMVTAVTVDISISSWRKSHRLSEEHVAHTDEAEVSNKERTIQRLVDDRDMWRALGKTSLAERAEEAITKLRDAKPAHISKGRGRDPYEAAILRAEKARRWADGP